MKSIEDKVQQWITLDEHWTQYNLSRYQQRDNAKKLFEEIMQEIKSAYNSSVYAEV